MGKVPKMIQMLWLTIFYKIAPIMVGSLALNTLVNKSGTRNVGVPMPVLKSVAKLAHDVVLKAAKFESIMTRKKMPSSIALGANYFKQLEYYAFSIKEIITKQIDDETAKLRHPDLYSILFYSQWIPGA